MKKVLLHLFIIIMATALSILLVDSILHAGDATIMQALLIANLISISVAITLYAQVSDPGKTIHHFHPMTPIKNFGVTSNTSSPVTPKGMTKKGEKLSPEHKAKISASLKKRAAEKKAQKEKHEQTMRRDLAGKTIRKGERYIITGKPSGKKSGK